MKKKIKIIKIISSILILLEAVIIAVFFSLYLANINDLQDKISSLYIYMMLTGFLLLDILYIWFICLFVSSFRHNSDLKAAQVIGSDIQEAYNFAMLGLIVTDDNDTILWANDLFKERHIDVIDENLLTWQPDLSVLKDTNKKVESCKVNINARMYEVKLLPEAGLWIFKDVTDFEEVFNYSKEQAPVVGIVTIDNLNDIETGDASINDIINQVKGALFTYSEEYGVLLRAIKNDTYTMICNYDSYSRMRKDNFSIIDTVRDICKGMEIPLTLSIGIGREFPDVIKLNELATEALDIAMSRGGDQVVVSAYGSEMEFYGGRTNATEKRSRVRTRVLADSLIAVIKKSQKVFVMGHSNMDMDALGACLGIRSICERIDIPCYIVADLKNMEQKTRAALLSSFDKEELDNLVLSSRNAMDESFDNALLVLVDVHVPSMTNVPELVEKCNKIVVIDHHRRGEDFIETPVFNYIDPASSSTCEIISEFIKFSSINPRIEINSTYATIMLSGIFLDSSYFKSKNTGLRTFDACTILKEFGADNALADDFLKDDYEEHTLINSVVSHLDYPAYGIAIACADEDTLLEQSTIAKAADLCLSFKGVRAAFVIGKTSNREIRVSCRSDGSVNVQLLAERLGGGGRFTSAAITFEKMSLEEIKQSITNVIISDLSEATDKRNIASKED